MKNVLKIINILLTLLALAISLATLTFRIILFITKINLLVPFSVIFCYVSLVFAFLVIILNVVTYYVFKTNRMIPIAIFSTFVSLLIFIISLCV
jgi:hypothetical protein